MSEARIRGCRDRHLAGKVRPDQRGFARAWCDAAEANFTSARSLLNSDANGALILTWAGMHKIAKALVGLGNHRLEGETHGKVADFLACCFADALDERQRALFQQLRSDRNVGAYDDPTRVNTRLVAEGLNLARLLVPTIRGWVDR